MVQGKYKLIKVALETWLRRVDFEFVKYVMLFLLLGVLTYELWKEHGKKKS